MGDIGELGTILSYIGQLEQGSDEWKKAMTSAYNIVIAIGEAQLQYEKDVAAAEADHAEKRLQLEQEYADHVKEVNQQLEEDIESLNKKYEDAVKSRADSLYRSYGLFDEVKPKDDVSGDALIKNLKGQVAEFDEWQSMLQSLRAKGVDDALIEELQEMGPSAIANVRALNGMTSTQLTQYVNLWSTKHRQARDQATGELEGMRADTQKQIDQLKVDAANDLEEYKKVWQTKMSELDESLQKTLKDLETDFHKSIGLISKYTQEELTTMVGNVSQLLGEKGFNVGTNLLQGIIKGFEEEKPNLLKAAGSIASAIVAPIKEGLDIHSPSRVTYQLAIFTARGFINALNDMRHDVYNAGNSLAEASSEGISNAIQYMMNLLDGNIDTQPTIRPVLDLSDVSRTAANLDNLLYAEQTARLASNLEFSMNRKSPATSRIVIDNGDVVEAIHELRADMAAMSEAIGQMQVVLDTGTTVGALAGPLDMNLGRRQIYRRRGN
jgi:F0F1-type ATP synthase membrane subunit b/b'